MWNLQCTQTAPACPMPYLDAVALPTLHDRYAINTEALSARVKAWLG